MNPCDSCLSTVKLRGRKSKYKGFWLMMLPEEVLKGNCPWKRRFQPSSTWRQPNSWDDKTRLKLRQDNTSLSVRFTLLWRLSNLFLWSCQCASSSSYVVLSSGCWSGSLELVTLESSFFLSGAVSGKIPPSADLSVARLSSVCRSVNGSQEDYLVDGTWVVVILMLENR